MGGPQRFDPAGDYVRRYVPGLAALSPARIHILWTRGSVTRIPLVEV